MNLTQLYNIAHPISEAMSTINKYTYLGYHKIIPVKYLDINDTFLNQIPIKNYIAKFGSVLLFPNIVKGQIVDLYIRPLNTKETPLKLGNKQFLYNMGNFNPDFKYGDPIVLVEGIADLAGVKLIAPKANIIAMQSNALPADYYEILASLTHNIVIVADNDEAGLTAAYQMRKEFKKHNVTVSIIKQYSVYKDTGDIIDEIMKYKKTKSETTKRELNIAKEYYKLQLELNQVLTQ